MNRSSDRDQVVERLIRQSPQSRSETDDCLDTEALAAWIDGGLSGSALEHAEAHVAICARCQAIVGAVVRVDPERSSQPASRRWIGWLVPLTAAAAALALWVAIPRDGTLPAAERASARMDDAAAPATQELPMAMPQPPVATRRDAPVAAPSPSTSGSVSPVETRKESGRVGGVDLRQRQLPLEGAMSKAEADGVAASSDAALPVPAPKSTLPSAPRASVAAPSASASDGLSRRPQPTLHAPVPGIASPDGSVFWRFGGSSIDRSTDGLTWETVFRTEGIHLTSGSATSATVCWVVGRAGVVLRATDGRTFSRVSFPSAVDLLVVRAVDAQSASVTTSDGRSLSTGDGGVSWR